MLLSLLTMSTLTAGKIVSESPLLSDSNPDVKPPLQTFSLRPMTLNDISILAGQSAEAYWYVVQAVSNLPESSVSVVLCSQTYS